MKLEASLDLDTLLTSANLAEKLSDQDLATISSYCSAGFEADMTSRLPWEEKMSEAMKLALQVKEEKNFPWQGASNVKFPLITIAAIQFHSRAYPALIQAPNLVSCQAFGKDPQGLFATSAAAVSQHMSWQLLEEDKQWEEETDRALLCLPILGSVFKKSYFDPQKKHNVSETLLPSEFVVNYWTKALETSPRMTHIQYHFANSFHENVTRGVWLDHEPWIEPNVPMKLGPLAQARDEAQGTYATGNDYDQPVIVLEQCCFLDLDGDGYREPYTVTFRHDNSRILRIKARFTELDIEKTPSGKVVKICPENPYTKIPFIPSPDGGFYDLGFGVLLGPINESIDSAINQLIDAGTMSNAGGGFLGRGIRVKGGNYSFTPNEWKRVDSTGDDLRNNIFPLPVREPSATLLNLLQLLISYGEKVAGSTEAVSGENVGQNTKTGTMDSMLEQGLKIFNGIYKRTWRALRDEYRKLFRLNKLFLNESTSFISMVDNEEKKILISAYNLPDTAIRPEADPNYMSDKQRADQARMVRQASIEKPLYNNLELERWYLQSMKVPNIDTLLVKEEPQPSPPYQVQIAQMKEQTAAAKLEKEREEMMQDFQLELLRLSKEADVAQAEILELNSKALFYAEQAATAQSDAEISVINAQIGAAKLRHDTIIRSIEAMSKITERRNKS